MRRSSEIAAIAALAVGTICACSSPPALAQEEPNEEVLALIIEFVKDSDRETLRHRFAADSRGTAG